MLLKNFIITATDNFRAGSNMLTSVRQTIAIADCLLLRPFRSGIIPLWTADADTPDNFRKRYYDNNVPHKDTFKNRELTTEPKFVQKRRQKAAVQRVEQSCLLPEIKMPDFV